MNTSGNQAGLINHGFLSAEFGPMSLAVGNSAPNLAPPKGMEETFKRRWERLQQLDGALRSGEAGLDRSFADYHEYYRGAWAIMSDPRVPEIFTITDEDKKRYGGSSIGNCLALARNLLRADAGTRFIMASHTGWDHHGAIYQEKLVICMSEFGRTPGPISETRKGREHHIHVHAGMFAGGGIKRGAVIGKTDEAGGQIVDHGWSAKRPIYMEDIACTIYSALGINWTKIIQNTPSGRAFHYVEPASGTKYVGFKPVQEFFA
jgi:hypothetical protein